MRYLLYLVALCHEKAPSINSVIRRSDVQPESGHLRKLRGRERDRCRADVFLKILDPPRAWDGHGVVILVPQPSERICPDVHPFRAACCLKNSTTRMLASKLAPWMRVKFAARQSSGGSSSARGAARFNKPRPSGL